MFPPMDKLELIEGLIDKLDSVNRLLPSYLSTGGLWRNYLLWSWLCYMTSQ